MLNHNSKMSNALLAGLAIIFLPLLSLAQESMNYRTPRTEYGVPDLQGLWEKRFATPVERPIALGNKRAYTEVEAADFRSRAIERRIAREAPVDPNRGPPPAGGDIEFRTDTNFLPSPRSTSLARGIGLLRMLRAAFRATAVCGICPSGPVSGRGGTGFLC